MTTLNIKTKNIVLDDDGFLTNFEDWDEDVANELASREGLQELTAERLEIIRFMRDYYRKFKAFPILNYICKNLHKPRECVTNHFVNPMKAWKIAGLPHLDGIHFVSVDGDHYSREECC